MAENPFRGKFTTETQRERRLEIQREQRRRKSRRQESAGREHRFPITAQRRLKPSAGHKHAGDWNITSEKSWNVHNLA